MITVNKQVFHTLLCNINIGKGNRSDTQIKCDLVM